MPDEEIKRIMEDYDLDEDEAEKAQEIVEEWGVDKDEAVEIAEEL